MANVFRVVQLVIVNAIAGSYIVPKRFRTALLRIVGYQIGDGFRMNSGGIIRCSRLVVGEDVFVNHRVIFDDGEVIIGNHVYISANVYFRYERSHDRRS